MERLMRFSDLAEINPRTKLSKGSEYPFVSMEVVSPGRRYVKHNEARVFKSGGAKFKTGDTLFARITPCLENGKIAQYSAPSSCEAFGSTEFFVFRYRKGISDPSYIFYLAFSETVRATAEKSMSGASGRQRADIGAIGDLMVPAPPLPTQCKIGSILSAYDDLIENNARRIEILEEMARMIHQEWFVKFRFPGHEKIKMVDGIPEGWPPIKVTEAIEFNPRIKVPKETEKPYVAMGEISENSMLVSVTEIRTGNSGSKFQNGDTLFARITPCLENGKTGFVQFLPSDDAVAIGSTEFIVMRSKTLCPEYVYLLARDEDFRENAIKSMSGASGRQRVSKECFDKFFIAHPDDDIVSLFSDTVSPLFKEIHVLTQKNTNLRTTRDLLLPKLISGEVDVSELDIAIPEEAAA